MRNNYAIENYHSSQTNNSAESTKNWCVDELINFKEPFSGLEELDFNPVSYDATTQVCVIKARLRCSNSAVTLIEQSIKNFIKVFGEV